MDNYMKERVQEHGFAAGQDAQYMRSVGATDEQVRNYVNFKNQNTPAEYKQYFVMAARDGFVKPSMFDHPVYDAHKANMRWYVANNAACVRSK